MKRNIQDLAIGKIQRDESTQARVRTDDDVAGEYSEILEELPEPIVFFDGTKYWLGDGWHTVRGHELKGKRIVRCEVRKGTRLDAIVYAAGANARHGLRRTNADKRRAIWLLITACAKWTNSEIARHCRVDKNTVSAVRGEMESANSGEVHRTVEGENYLHDGLSEPNHLVDNLTPSQKAVYNSMTAEEREHAMKECETDTLDEHLNAAEVVIFRIEKRLGDDDIGKSIRNDLKLFRLHMRGAVGWEEAQRTVVDEGFKERTLIDLDRLRKLNNGMPGERNRTMILDRLVKKVEEAA